jgi:hypothetical protein
LPCHQQKSASEKPHPVDFNPRQGFKAINLSLAASPGRAQSGAPSRHLPIILMKKNNACPPAKP